MTEQQHPITPTPELVQQWRNAARPFGLTRETWIATQAARWGADQELEGCCEWLRSKGFLEPAIEDLRAVRRPKPLGLAEEALTALEKVDEWAVENMRQFAIHDDLVTGVETIRRALERLQKLEKGNE